MEDNGKTKDRYCLHVGRRVEGRMAVVTLIFIDSGENRDPLIKEISDIQTKTWFTVKNLRKRLLVQFK